MFDYWAYKIDNNIQAEAEKLCRNNVSHIVISKLKPTSIVAYCADGYTYEIRKSKVEVSKNK